MARRGGQIQVQVNGVLYQAKGEFTYSLGRPKRDAIVGSDNRVHGFKETGQVPYIEGKFTDAGDLDLNALLVLQNATVTLALANEKMIVLSGAYYASEGEVTTEEGEISVRFEGTEAEEVA